MQDASGSNTKKQTLYLFGCRWQAIHLSVFQIWKKISVARLTYLPEIRDEKCEKQIESHSCSVPFSY